MDVSDSQNAQLKIQPPQKHLSKPPGLIIVRMNRGMLGLDKLEKRIGAD